MNTMFIDNVTIHIKAGDGGNGCVAFHREKYVAEGGPSGGDGGNGGNIVFKIDEGTNTLLAFRYRRKFIAENGGDGGTEKFHGKNGEDTVILVPPGTIIKDAETGRIIKDMSDCEPYTVLKGGRGGWGNRHFATPTRQIPRFAKPGLKGEEADVTLELKMLADVGLVGFPNVGKSSLLSVVSSARPKIANYHFTTLQPQLGVVKTGEDGFVLADIPGLIEGAAEGAGLGHDFLRHVDRCRLLIHVVDVSGAEGRDPVDDIKKINSELERYSPELASRPQIFAANKVDACDTELVDLTELEAYVKGELGCELFYISAATRQGVDELMWRTAELLSELPPLTIYESEEAPAPELAADGEREIIVKNVNGVYYVEGEWLMQLIDSVNFGDRESVAFFQRILRQSGVIDALTAKGCEDGDTVNIYDIEFDFIG